MIDFIGDIHGHADKLKSLLRKLGYSRKNGAYQHSDRRVIFVGDYIDRGPQIIETLDIVRRMVDAGNAIALMGNHEYNAICFHHLNKEGGHLRPHLLKNIYQHMETIRQYHLLDRGQKLYDEYIQWFKTLPLFHETPAFRAVHACWDMNNIDFLQNRLKQGNLNDDLIYESVQEKNELYTAIDETLKGKEIPMPAGQFFVDKDNHKRTSIRIKWWEDPVTTTYRELSIPRLDTLPDKNIDTSLLKSTNYYQDTVPVFFGHYWLEGTVKLHGSNVCCLDYSVAKKGSLVAYQFDGESELNIDNFLTA